VLKTGQKDAFLTRLRHAINENAAKAITTQSKDLAWHPNENNTRWFLVIRLKLSAELSKLLDICNGSVKEHGQPLLYAEGGKSGGDEFHISIAWSLKCPTMDDVKDRKAAVPVSGSDAGIPYRLLEQLSALQIEFKEVKVRIGQDVNLIALKSRR
jgi:exonuclease I